MPTNHTSFFLNLQKKMNFKIYKKKIFRYEKYTATKWTNSTLALTIKLDTSERTVFQMIEHLKAESKQIEC